MTLKIEGPFNNTCIYISSTDLNEVRQGLRERGFEQHGSRAWTSEKTGKTIGISYVDGVWSAAIPVEKMPES